MATLGQTLISPESGWRRYDDTDSRIAYTGNWGMETVSGEYATTTHYTNTNGNKAVIKFYGTKIRIMAKNTIANSANITIKIDGVSYNMSEYTSGSTTLQALSFESTGLSLGIHSIEIILNDTAYLNIDAIDIDLIGDLVNNIYLIKQNNNYYTIKSSNYDSTTNHMFTPLILLGGAKPNDNDYNNFGFIDFSVLNNSMTVGIDTFIPKNKFLNIGDFDIKMYKPN